MTMPKHIIRDSLTRSKFTIIGFDEETGMLNVNYEKDGWIKDFECRQKMPLGEFINTLMEGRLEIRPSKNDKFHGQPPDY
jgi:hypothetical protein